jgi:hypothetical protein
MRHTLVLTIAAIVATAAPVITLSSLAHADNEFEVSVAKGSVTVTTHPGWHINKDYPWKLTIGDTKLDKSKFSLEETSAKVDAPKGAGKLKGAVCSKEQCYTFEKEVSIQ